MRIRRKIFGSGIAVAIVSMAAVLLGAGPASADSSEYFRNQATGKCLDVEFASGVPVPIINNPGVCDPVWNVHVWADGTRELRYRYGNAGCLDDSSYGLRMFPCNSMTYQSWYVDYPGNGTVAFRNQATGRCLDASLAYGVRTVTCNGLGWQQWS